MHGRDFVGLSQYFIFTLKYVKPKQVMVEHLLTNTAFIIVKPNDYIT